MIVEQYGLVYKRVSPGDLEMLRYWRNQDYIRNTMQFKSYITPSMQKAWFERINNKYNYYFIIENQGRKIGMINCKDTIPNTRIAEGGIFIWDQSYWGTPIPVFAALTMLECVFELFQSGDSSVATVAKTNQPAIQFNKILGYTILDSNPSGDFLKLILTKEQYLKTAKKLKRSANLYSKGQSAIKVTATPSDLLADEINVYLRRHS